MTVRHFAVVVVAALTIGGSTLAGQIGGQPQGGGRGRAGGPPPPPANLPESPTAVALPTISAEVTGPGPIFDSSPSLAPGKGLAAFNYEAHEYFVSGTANGEPYTTRIVVRKPADNVEVQRPRARRSDARQRRRTHVRVHLDLYDVLGPRRGRDPDHATGAVRRAQRSALQEPEAQWRTDERDPRADRRRSFAAATWLADSVRKMVLAGTSMTAGVLDQLPAGAHGVPHAADAAHLRRLPADVERLDDSRHRRADDPRPDDARGERQHHQPTG